MPARLRCIFLVLALLAYLPPVAQWWREKAKHAPATFVVSKPNHPVQSSPPPAFQTEFITPDVFLPSAHVASLCESPDGTLCAAWYGGSREGARDVNIFWSRRAPGEHGSWSKPEVLVSPASAAQELRRPIKKVGNAMLFVEPAGKLQLIYVTVSVGGWSTSSLNVKTSRDRGQTWLPSQRLVLSPFFNLSELVKNKPCALSDATLAVPIYHECLGKFPEILWMQESAAGELSYSKTRLFGGRFALQPALVPLDAESALVFCRSCSSARQIHMARCTNLGKTSSPPQPMALPNSDSGLDALRLSDGRILLAFNDSGRGRENLSLALSGDAGLNWSRRAILESDPGEEFSYPYLIQTGDGQIHVVYTWKRKAIKHTTFNLSWLDTQPKAKALAPSPPL